MCVNVIVGVLYQYEVSSTKDSNLLMNCNAEGYSL